MTFTKLQQGKHRQAFIEDCRQKAWGAACHADWISKGLDELLAHYGKLTQEDGELEAKIKEAETALDYHTVENRNKRKAMQERRTTLGKQMQFTRRARRRCRTSTRASRGTWRSPAREGTGVEGR